MTATSLLCPDAGRVQCLARAPMMIWHRLALEKAAQLKGIFGDRFYLELTNHDMPGDDKRNDMLAEIGMRLGIESVATNNVHYAHRHDADLSEVLSAIAGRRNLTEADGFRPATDLRHLRTPHEMEKRFARYAGAVERAADLGTSLAFDLDLLTPELPDFPMPGSFTTEDEYLSDLVYGGAADVYPGSEDGIDPRARRRLEHELGVIGDLGFAGYFLVGSWLCRLLPCCLGHRSVREVAWHLLPDKRLRRGLSGVPVHQPHTCRPDSSRPSLRAVPLTRTGETS